MPWISRKHGRRKCRNLKRWVVCVCVCGGGGLAELPVRFAVCSGGLVLSLYDTHEAEPLGSNWFISLTARLNMKHAHMIHTLWDATNTLSWPRDATGTSPANQNQNFEVMHCHCSNDITCKYFVYFYLILLYQMRKFRSFVINVSIVLVTVPEEGYAVCETLFISFYVYCAYFSHSAHFSGCLRMRGRRVHGMCAPLYFIKFLLVPCLIYEFTGRKMWQCCWEAVDRF